MNSTNIVGETLGGRYKIQSLIGQGGMASVYKAYDPNLHRAVAVKVIHPHLSNNPEFFRRFEEEATAVAQLRHPNIVQVYDFSHDEDLYYMVMEFVMGETLQTRLKRLNESRRRMPAKEAITFTAEICDAAYYAHQRGMIHRDIKPANIMLDVNGRAILMDFGIARLADTTQHTATGTVLGTATYMAPEQIQGLQIDARADIYSIGITLFEILSGRPPFEADSAMTLMMMHLNDPVPDLRQIHADTPADLVAITNNALAKNRDERYQSASEMAEALRKLPDQFQQAPVAAPIPTPDQTFIEATAVSDAGKTIIEPAVPFEPSPSQADYQPTLVEQVAQPVQPSAPPVGVPEKMPAEEKKGRAWLPVVLVLLVLIIGGGGYFAYTKFFAGGATNSPLPSPTAESVALISATETSEPTQDGTPTSQPQATESVLPSQTPTEAPTATPAPVVIGGADKIAYFA
ncbi:MAG: protein kinase, partial [Chloroflexota bacterium]